VISYAGIQLFGSIQQWPDRQSIHCHIGAISGTACLAAVVRYGMAAQIC
jgi:hypothetical protein